MLSRLEGIQTNDKNIRKGLDKAIISLEESLKDEYWKDDFHLHPRHMGRYYAEETEALNILDKISRDKKRHDRSSSTAEIQKLLEELKQIDTYLARIMLYEAGKWEAKDLKSAKEWAEGV